MPHSQMLELTGESGEKYCFTVYEVVPAFQRKVPCVYYISRRYQARDGEFIHKPIYVGQTEDFDKCFASHPEYACFKRHHFNCVSILPLNDARLRAGVKLDLINGLRPLNSSPLYPDWQPETSNWVNLLSAH